MSEANGHTTAGLLGGDGDVLITQRLLHRLAGSEVVVIELCEHFASQGRRVAVVTRSFSDEFVATHLSLPGVTVFRSTDDSLDDRLEEYFFSVAWVHHGVVPPVLFGRKAPPTVVFAHLSPFIPTEMAMTPGLERDLASAVVFNSQETLESHRDRGLYASVPDALLHVFPNPAPDAFSSVPQVELTHRRPRLLVVSNHIPSEVAAGLELLAGSFEITMVGSQGELGASEQRVDPSLMGEHDAVLSIGKTVQYALTAGRAVYCYDIHGGPGWLDASNVELAAGLNFSGRGFDRRSPGVIAEELRSGLQHAVEFATSFRPAAIDSYQFSRCLEALQSAIDANADHHRHREVRPDVAYAAMLLDRQIASLEESYVKALSARGVAVEKASQAERRVEATEQRCQDAERRCRDAIAERAATARLCEALKTSMEESDSRARALAQELARQRKAVEALTAEAERLRASASWRITAPLRRAAQIGKSVRVGRNPWRSR